MTALNDDTVDVVNITADFAVLLSDSSAQYAGVTRNTNVTINGGDFTITGNDSRRMLTFCSSVPYIFTVNNLTFADSSNYTEGGAVFITKDVTGVFNSCTFTNNHSTDNDGGALYVPRGGSPLTLNNCTFTGNSALDTIGYGGGAVFTQGDVTITNCVFTNNQATRSGALYAAGGITATNCIFENNSVIAKTDYAGNGGAVYLGAWQSAVFDSCTFLGNTVSSNIREAGAYIYSIKNIVFKGTNTVSRGSENDLGDYGIAFPPSPTASTGLRVGSWSTRE